MGWAADKIEEAGAQQAYETGGYPAWFQFKAASLHHKIKNGTCCA